MSSSQARRARNSRAPINVYLESEGTTELSVDRLSLGQVDRLVVIADAGASARRRRFYGWMATSALEARLHERSVVASPTDENPYHADIVLPDSVETIDDQRHHAQLLRDLAEWKARPPAPLP